MTRHKHRRTTKPMAMRKALRKGEHNRRAIGKVVVAETLFIAGQPLKIEREYTLHATKGFRAHRES